MHPKPAVGVLMGSDSDLEIMRKCLETLKGLGIPFEVSVLSAHRTPDECAAYVKAAPGRGVKVFIAAAGGAAHLAGAVAAHTTCPVIGVPIAATALQGFDSLLSTVQMPPGVPVATVAVGEFGAVNAAVLAAQILAVGDASLSAKLAGHKAEMAKKVLEKSEKVRRQFDG
jgi:phosphoribosylaminoimidazole carboxylase PurE protein